MLFETSWDETRVDSAKRQKKQCRSAIGIITEPRLHVHTIFLPYDILGSLSPGGITSATLKDVRKITNERWSWRCSGQIAYYIIWRKFGLEHILHFTS